MKDGRTRRGGFIRSTRTVWALAVSMIFIMSSVSAWAERVDTLPRKKLVVAVINDPPMTMTNERGQWTGFNVDLWRYLAAYLGLEYELKEMTFNEVRKALKDGTIDISIAALLETADRHGLFDFSTSVGTTQLVVAVPADRDSYPWSGTIKAFLSWGVMKTVLPFVAVLFALGFILWRIERNPNPDHFGGRAVKGIGSGAYWVGSTLAAGACHDVMLKSGPARFIGLLWMLIGAIVFSIFTASLASTLLSNRQMIEVYDVKKLRSMRLGVVRGTVQHSLIQRTGGRYALFDTEEGALTALKARKIDGFLMDELVLNYYAARNTQDPIRIHPTQFGPLRFAFAFPKGSPLRRPINIELTRIMDSPEWNALAGIYGLDSNLEPKPLPLGKRSRFSN